MTSLDYLCVSGALITPVFLLIVTLLRKNVSVIEPPFLILLTVLWGMSIKTCYIFFLKYSGIPIPSVLLNGDSSVISLGIIASMLGVAGFAVGYLLNVPSMRIKLNLLSSNIIWNHKVAIWLGVALTLFSLLSFYLFLHNSELPDILTTVSGKRFLDSDTGGGGRLASLQYYYYKGATLAKYVFYILFIVYLQDFYKKTVLFKVIVLLAFILTLFIPFFFGNRAGMILPILDALIIYYIISVRFNWFKVSLYLSFALVFFMIASSFRVGEIRNDDSYIHALHGRYFLDVVKTSAIIDAVPRKMEYSYGESLVGFLFVIVPKEVWEGKPSFMEVSWKIGDIIFNESFNSIPPGLIAELYMNFSWVGIFLGMFLLGVVARGVYQTYIRYKYNINVSLIYTLIVTRLTIFSINNDFGTMMLKMIIDLLPILLILWFISVTPKMKYYFDR